MSVAVAVSVAVSVFVFVFVSVSGLVLAHVLVAEPAASAAAR